MKNPDCECCRGNEYYCMGCDPNGDQPEMPHGYKHPAGYVWDAENHRQLSLEEWNAMHIEWFNSLPKGEGP